MRGLSLKTYKRIEQILALLRENGEMHVRGIARALQVHPFTIDKIVTDYLDFFLEKRGVNIFGFRAVLVRFKPGKESAKLEEIIKYIELKRKVREKVKLK